MLTVDDFKKRVKQLWESQKRMAAPKKWKSGKRAGQERRPAVPIEFTEYDFGKWLWACVGLNAIPCPYCNKPIDIVSLTIDHILPRSDGGRFALENMQCICQECNERKGEMSARGFTQLLKFIRTELAPVDQKTILKRLKAAHQGSARRFFRDKDKSSPKPPQEPHFELPANF